MNIIWKKPDGTLAVTHLTAEAESPQAEAAKLQARGDIPADWELAATHAELPSSREFRDAWQWTDKVDVHFPRAREITRQRLRSERAPRLVELDVAYQRADEAGDAALKKQVATEKQRLRDITKTVDTCTTLDELRALKV